MLHDNLQQLIAAAKINVEILGSYVQDKDMQETAEDAIKLLNKSMDISRSLSIELIPPVLNESGLIDSLRWLCNWVKEKYKINVTLQVQKDADINDNEIKMLLFESVRELLFNIKKHAGVTEANIQLNRAGDYIEVVVSDEGAGFDLSGLESGPEMIETGFGLFSIRESITLVKGDFKIDSEPGQGTKITLTMPLPLEDFSEVEKPEAKTQPEILPKQSTDKKKVRVLLVDDHTVLRQGLSSLLNKNKDIEIVGQASDGKVAIEKSLQLHPDVILMDYNMPEVNGVEATSIIHSRQPDIHIIGLSMY